MPLFQRRRKVKGGGGTRAKVRCCQNAKEIIAKNKQKEIQEKKRAQQFYATYIYISFYTLRIFHFFQIHLK